nr:transposase [Psychromonas antarctica]
MNSHTVSFTLPYQLRILARQHPNALYQLRLQVTADILKDFAAKQNKGSLGFTSVLHTHSRRRECHPHVHIIVPCGRYDATKKTVAQK